MSTNQKWKPQKCKKCDAHANLKFISLIGIARPQDYVLVQCPKCFMVDTIPVEYWFYTAFVDAKAKTEATIS